MATNEATSIPLPSSLGSFGASVDVSRFNADIKTFIYTGSSADVLTIEHSPDGSNWTVWGKYAGQSKTTQDRFRYLRAKRDSGATTGALNLIAAEDETGAADGVLLTFTKSAADGAASTATALATYKLWPATKGGVIKSLTFAPFDNVTADATDYAELHVTVDGTSVGSMTTEVTGFTAGTPRKTSLNAAVDAGEVIGIGITKEGSGVVIPAGVFIVEFE